MASGDGMSRYIRQTSFAGFPAGGQDLIGAAHVLVVGAGGLGVPVLQYLTGAGVGTLTLVDGDHVAETNLHRQPLYRVADIGRAKCLAAGEALQGLNPEVTINAVPDWLTPTNAPDFIANADLVLDCADTFAVSLTLSDATMRAGKPLISASALGLSGYVGGFCGTAPSLRAVFPDLPRAAATCATAGVLGPVVATIGALQAQMALAVLLGQMPSPLGQMMVLDATNWRMSDFRFDDAEESNGPLPFIGVEQIAPDDVVVDLRTEMAAPFRQGALHLSADDLSRSALPDNDTRIVLACRTGLRAHHAATALRARFSGPIALLAVPDT